MKKPLLKRKWFIALMVILGLGIIGSFIPNDATTENGNIIEESEHNYLVEESEHKYRDSGTWAVTDSGYVFAVEEDSYNGDIYESGTYRFYPDNVSSVEKGEMIKGYTQMV